MKLLVGLGNPGPRYHWTRHNVGFMVMDRISEREGIPLDEETKYAILGRGDLWGEEFLLAKPKTYMNASGLAVKRIVDDYGLPTDGVMVIHDDMDIEFGRIRIKDRGGDGGHLGIRSLIDALGGGSFLRIRIGIGRPDKEWDVVDYVLSPFSPEEKQGLNAVMDMAIEALECITREGIERAKNRFNVRKKVEGFCRRG